MKVVSLVAGAAGMYCGSCLRDNRLAATLLGQGRDVVLVPLYTPIRTDETDVSQPRVYYGGINVFVQQSSALFRRTPWWIDRLLDARALLRSLGRFAGNTRAESLGPLTVSVLRGEDGNQHKELDKLVAGLAGMGPDLITLPNLMFLGVARRLKASLNVPVLCTLGGEDIFLDQLPEPHRTEAFAVIAERALDVDGFIAVTDYYASHATNHFTLPADRVHVVPMGISLEGIGAMPDRPDEPFTIGYLARVCPEKGLARLVDAYVQLRRAGRNCRLRVAGYLSAAERPYLAHIESRVRQAGFGDGFEYIGEVDRAGKLALLRSLHVMSVPTVYHESKGLYVLEAMACGVPVVQPRHGAFPELVEATGGGLLVDPAGPDKLAEGLAQLMDDASLRNMLAEAGYAAVRESFSDTVMAEKAWELYQRYGAGAGK